MPASNDINDTWRQSLVFALLLERCLFNRKLSGNQISGIDQQNLFVAKLLKGK